MLLDIMITHWTEPWEIGKKAFDILALQRLVSWDEIRITLVHDGSEAFPDHYFKDYPYRVRQVCLPHGGIAAARNWCIENGTATWIKWCDFDDMFTCVSALREIVNALKNAQQFDMLWFEFLWEMDGKHYRKTDRDPVLLHGKILRRSFLKEHGIRFQEYLTFCEDSAFLALVEMEIDHQRIGKIKTEAPAYLYLVRQGSLCNRPEILFDNRMSFFQRHRYVAEELRKHGEILESERFTVRTMGDSYLTLVEIGTDDRKKLEAHEREVWAYFKEHRDEFLRVTSKDFDEVLAFVNKENSANVTKAQLLAWIRKLRIKYEGE